MGGGGVGVCYSHFSEEMKVLGGHSIWAEGEGYAGEGGGGGGGRAGATITCGWVGVQS